jgi:hypothetical protein
MPYDVPATQARHSFLLPRRSSLVLDGARGTTIAVVRGSLWVTQERDMRDIILEDGARFVIDRDGRTIIAAEEDSRLRLRRGRTRFDRLFAWLSRAGKALAGSLPRRERPRQVPYY